MDGDMTNGPPLRTILFPLSSTADLYFEYAIKLSTAIEGLAREFSGVSLSRRVAILVPDVEFRELLCHRLREKLPDHELVTAAQSTKWIGRGEMLPKQ